MITSEGYTLFYSPGENRIVIHLPQTMETATNTVAPIANRRTDIKESDMCCLLTMTKILFKNAKMGGADG